MKKKEKVISANTCREELRRWLVKWTCDIQVSKDGKKWPCGTYFMALLNDIGLDKKKPEYKVHNKPISRHNEVWRAILQIRDAEL